MQALPHACAPFRDNIITVKRTVLYEGHIITLTKLDDKWEVVEHDEAVCVLVRQNGKVLGVKQHRPAINQTTWELPAGLIDPGETPEQAARRELTEEASLTGDLSFITQIYSSPGFTTEKVYVFEATNVRAAYADADEDEDLTVDWRAPEEVWQHIQEGRIASSAPTVAALAYALGVGA